MRSIFYFFLLANLSFCTFKENPDSHRASNLVYKVNLLEEETFTPTITNFVKGYSLTHIQEADTNQLIKSINKVEASREYLFVLDRYAPSLRQYDTLGRFIRYFGKLGEGPGEYNNLETSDISLSPSGEEIWLYINSKLAIQRYDITSGAFLGDTRVEAYPVAFWPSPRGEMYFYNAMISSDLGNYNLFSVSAKGQVEKKYFPFKSVGKGFGGTGFLNKGYCASPFSDSVFQITEGGPELRFLFTVGDDENRERSYEDLDRSYLGSRFVANDHYCLFTAKLGRKVTNYIYDRRSNKVFKFPNVPDLDFYWIQHGRPVGLDASGRNFLISFEAESLPAVEAFCRQLQLPLIGPGLAQPPQTGHLIMTLHMK
ncbi:MAG: 6-bladed beta-propeller [Bernardetiaceae bacterium]|jgi:hypothetical protein|nr:6-bladed beta-propeller [Bernardetiaceae bacterium]